MNVLPWLVLHGAAVWQASLVALTLAGLAFATLRPRLAARRAAAAARRRLGEPVGLYRARRDKRVTLAGELFAADAACPAGEDGVEVAAVSGAGASARADRLLLRVGDAAVRLEGPVEVVTGSREAWPGRVLGRQEEQPVIRSLASGDRVLVSGVLGQEASDEAPSYRDAAKRWTLGGGLVAAFDGAPSVRGPVAAVRIPPVAAAGLLFLAVFGGGGELAMSLAARELTVYASSAEGGDLAAVAVAAATPFRRGDALRALAHALDARRDPEPTALAARAALHTLSGAPAEAAAMWIAHGEPERGARLAEVERRFALAARGGTRRASSSGPRTPGTALETKEDEAELRFGLGVQLFAGRFDRAAHAARRLAAAMRAHPADNDRLRAGTRPAPRSWAASPPRSTRAEATPRRGRRSTRTGTAPLLPACAVLRIDLFDGAERLQALRALPSWPGTPTTCRASGSTSSRPRPTSGGSTRRSPRSRARRRCW